ncbi:MAG: hypothetical protein DRJ15_10490 [Bacteroidetes bacterium]|nr:MAG: hypothetical protein DRJ15_10490 [Bacteroidota bacterium]
MDTAYCLLSTAYCVLRTAYCVLRTAYCLLGTGYCLLSTSENNPCTMILRGPCYRSKYIVDLF